MSTLVASLNAANSGRHGWKSWKLCQCRQQKLAQAGGPFVPPIFHWKRHGCGWLMTGGNDITKYALMIYIKLYLENIRNISYICKKNYKSSWVQQWVGRCRGVSAAFMGASHCMLLEKPNLLGFVEQNGTGNIFPKLWMFYWHFEGSRKLFLWHNKHRTQKSSVFSRPKFHLCDDLCHLS